MLTAGLWHQHGIGQEHAECRQRRVLRGALPRDEQDPEQADEQAVSSQTMLAPLATLATLTMIAVLTLLAILTVLTTLAMATPCLLSGEGPSHFGLKTKSTLDRSARRRNAR